MLWKRLAVLVAAAMIVLSMLVAAPAFAQPEEFPGEGSGATDRNPGMSEGSRSWHTPPPGEKPGAARRDTTANEKNPDSSTGRGERIA